MKKKWKCSSASETAEWINAIVEFLTSYSFFTDAHLVNFFNDRLWESLDKDWIECLRREPVEVLLQIPSGLVKDHWPPSLKHFLLTLNSLLFPRQPNLPDLQSVFGFSIKISLTNDSDKKKKKKKNVIWQGMNPKKKHEVEILSAVVSCIANSFGPHTHTTIFDVGAGQGYLSQVLSFESQHSVVAIDASSHHGSVTDTRARRIYKHYYSQFTNSNTLINLPKTITSHVISVDALKHLVSTSTTTSHDHNHNVVLAGLHACGDLSVIMLRTFLESPQVRAIVSLGCCYNLLTEDGCDHVDPPHGFPLSHTVKSSAFSLGKTLRDLACQSAERWRCLQADDGIHNFELHAFRAAFQMLLKEYYPDIMITSPSIGRQGKALRRLQKRETRMENKCPPVKSTEPKTGDSSSSGFKTTSSLFHDSHKGSECNSIKSVDKHSLFQRYSQSGLCHLGLEPSQDINFRRIWDEVEPFSELIGPYWSLRAALGPLLETFILLDRLLFLQEAGNSIETMMLPIFDPELSPRNVAIIAKKN